MKIKHILEYDYPEHRVRDVKRLPDQYKTSVHKPGVMKRDPKVKHRGSGAFASTYSHPDRPHDIRRISKHQTLPDGFRKYYEELQKHDDKDNPYFPQFSQGTTYRKDISSVLSVQTQRLRRLEELTKKETESVLERWFGEDYNNIVWNKLFPYGSRSGWDYDKPGAGATIVVELLRKIMQTERTRKYVIDQELKDALDFIKYRVVGPPSDVGVDPPSDDPPGPELDLFSSNIMYKRSRYGIQIVLTDPVA